VTGGHVRVEYVECRAGECQITSWNPSGGAGASATPTPPVASASNMEAGMRTRG
jgi:hypothetical protein